jgi:ketosteroid isomerase-like protein
MGYSAAMSQEDVEVVRRLYEAIERRDSEAVLALYDPDVEWDMSGYPYGEMLDTRSRGHAGLRAFWRELYEAWESYEHDCRELIDAGDHVISIVTDRARGRASGADVEIAAFGVWTVSDGRIIRSTWFRTRAEAFEAAGLEE